MSSNREARQPATRRDDVVETLHGVEVHDPYRWLEDQAAADTRRWIDAQNRWTRSHLDGWPHRAALEARLGELLRVDATGVPVERGGRLFWSRRAADQEQPVFLVRPVRGGRSRVLIDANTLSDDLTVTYAVLDIALDGTLVAWGRREGGKDELEVYFRDVATGRDLPVVLPLARYFGGVTLSHDLRYAYASRMDDAGPRVYRHDMATGEETLIFGEGFDPGKIIGLEASDDGRTLLVTVFYGSAGERTEVYTYRPETGRPPEPLVTDLHARFYGAFAGSDVVLQTDWEAPRWRVLLAPGGTPDRSRWRVVVPEGEDAIQSVAPIGGTLFVNTLHNASTRIAQIRLDGTLVRTMRLPGIGTAAVGGDWPRQAAWLVHTSFASPQRIFRLDARTGARRLWARSGVRFDGRSITVRQVWFRSKDSTRVPMFVIHRRGLERDGSAPTLLTGYGGFGAAMTPAFSVRAAVLCEQGGVVAIPCLRGGGEFGEEWHRGGMLATKQNTFDDFLAAAQYLIRNRYTSPQHLAISGGSNGGLLVGAATVQRPDLFRAVVCSVPLLDMIRYHRFLVAAFWVPEYGSSDDAAQFPVLMAYSPYHHVQRGAKYPAMLFQTGDSDTRVAPLHARKMCAMVQWASRSGLPVLLRYDTKQGHSGGQSVSKTIEELTDELSFVMQQLGTRYAKP